MKTLAIVILVCFAVITFPPRVSAGDPHALTPDGFRSVAALGLSSGGLASLPAQLPAAKLSGKYKQMLSGAGHNALYGKWREKLPALRESIQSLKQQVGTSLQGIAGQLAEGEVRGPIQPFAVIPPVSTVNNKLLEVPSINTQSEPSIAVSGSNVVIGFNNSFDFAIGSGFSGYSFSTNSGTSFTQVVGGLVPPTSDIFPLGDPSLAVDAAGNFYYATLAQDFVTGDSYVLIYKSIDGGATFPGVVGIFVPCCDFLDKELIAIDNANNKLYVSYTDFLDPVGTVIFTCRFTASTGAFIGCVSLTAEDAQGSMPTVGPSGELYVAWEQFSNTGSPTEQAIFFAKSTNGGASFSAPAKITDVNPIYEYNASTYLCDQPALKGGIRVNDFPSIAVDTGAKSKFKGSVYVAWNDMGSGDSEILGMRSPDGGVTWQGPVTINNGGAGTDQFFPWVNIKPNGQVGVIFYDRKNHPSYNWYIDLTLATSTNGGTSWSNSKITKKPFPVVVNSDSLIATCYMGDYNQITNNGTNFFMAWGDNSNGDPDVAFKKK